MDYALYEMFNTPRVDTFSVSALNKFVFTKPGSLKAERPKKMKVEIVKILKMA
jgi:hypothetical protein